MADENDQWAVMPDEVKSLKAEHDRLVAIRQADLNDQEARSALKEVNLQLRSATQKFREIGEFVGNRTPLMVSVQDGEV